MNYLSKKEQIKVYFGKLIRDFKNKSKLVVLLGAITTPLIVRLITGPDSFLTTSSDAGTAIFILASACLWLGIFNTITSICKERDIIKHEYREGLDIKSYIASHMIFGLLIVLIEALIITILLTIFYNKNIDNYMVVPGLFISFFLIIYASNALGILISALVKNTETAMTVMPFVLLIQLVLAGNIKLEKLYLQAISCLMISKNGYDSILRLTGFTERPGSFPGVGRFIDYSNVSHFIVCWIILLGLSVLSGYLAGLVLEKNINK